MIALGGGWDEALAPLFADERYKKIREFLKYEYSHYTVYPDMYDLYNCFRYTPLAELKAVILGQDPYHEPGQAHGLCFSVKEGVDLPPSLKNIYKEIKSDLNITEPNCGDLTKWAKEGVLLLNTTIWIFSPELYPTRVRAFGTAFILALGTLAGAFIPTLSGWVLEGYGVAGMFTLMAGMYVTFAAVLQLAPETFGRPLDT